MNPIEKAAAKMIGKTAGVDARFKGLKGVFAKLAEQHHEAAALLSSAEKATDDTKRSELWRRIRKELLSHEQAELLEIYTVLEGYAATRDIAYAHAERASELEDLVDHVDALGVQSDAWRPAVQRLIVKLNAHVAEEEERTFPRAQQALGEERVKKLEQPFLRTQARVKDQLG